MTADAVRKSTAFWRRYKVLAQQLGLPAVAGFALFCFLVGFFTCIAFRPIPEAWAPANGAGRDLGKDQLRSLEDKLHAEKAALGGQDPCQDASVQGGEPSQAPSHRLESGLLAGELVLVTGCAGFIGSHLVFRLLQLGYNVRCFDNLETGNLQFLDLRHPRLDFHFGDILDLDALRAAVAGARGIFHLAAASKVLPSLKSPSMATFNIERNAVGTSNVLEAANETKLVRKVIYAGSSTFYGNQEVPFREDDPFVPSSPYAASKYMGELQMLTSDAVYRIPTLVLRFFMVYGPRNPAEGAYAIVTGKFVKRQMEGKVLLIEGTGSQFRDFVHVDDVARACILGYQSKAHGTVVNVGSGRAHTVKEVADLVSPLQEHGPARKHDLNGTLADTCRARRLLGFSSWHNFEATMRQMIADTRTGHSDYLAEMWQEPETLKALERRFHGWAQDTVRARAVRLRDALRQDKAFVAKLLQELGRRNESGLSQIPPPWGRGS